MTDSILVSSTAPWTDVLEQGQDVHYTGITESVETTAQRQPARVFSYRHPSAQSISPDTLTAEERIQEPASPGTLVVEEISHQDFANNFTINPSEALEALRSYVDWELVTRVQATEWLFPLLVEARGELKESLYKMLIGLQAPEVILRMALSMYDSHGKEERLTLAAALLHELGACAWPSLRALARTNLPICELFVPVIAYLSDVSVESRLKTLTYLVSNPSPDVRYTLLKALRAFPAHGIQQMLHTLANDTDEEVADEARAWLESLGI